MRQLFFCTMDGFFRILKKTSFHLLCTRLQKQLLEYYGPEYCFRRPDRDRDTQLGKTAKKPAKIQIEKIVKLTDDCTHNNLTSFGCEAHAMTGNGSFCELLKTCMELVNSHQMNLLLAGFRYLEPLWSRHRERQREKEENFCLRR